MRSTLSTKGQIVLPAALRQQDGLVAGQEVQFERVGPREYRLVVLAPPPNHGLVDWLLECPVKGFFETIESESTDTL